MLAGTTKRIPIMHAMLLSISKSLAAVDVAETIGDLLARFGALLALATVLVLRKEKRNQSNEGGEWAKDDDVLPSRTSHEYGQRPVDSGKRKLS